MTQAVILAGGAGTRLASVSGGLPKPLVPVAGIPVVERQIALLARYGVDEIFLTTGYGADMLAERLGDGARFGVRLHQVREEEPRGTAGGVAALRNSLTAEFLVLYGDVLVNMDLRRLLDAHRATGAAATLVVHPNDHPYDSDLVDLDPRGRVRGFYPKPRPDAGPDLPNMVSAALYVLSPGVLDQIEPDVSQDFVRDVFPRLLATGAALYGYPTTEYLKDMGTPDRLARVERDVEEGVVDARHGDRRRPTLFLDRDGVINREIGGVLEPGQLELLPGAASAIRRMNQAGWLVAGVTNQPAIAKGFMSEADLERVHLRLQRVLGDQGAWLDALVHCPHHPEKGFKGERADLKIECSCRKPAAGLLEDVARSIPVERGTAVVVGDSWRDMAAAHAFGAEAIGVLHGQTLSAPEASGVRGTRPDVVVADLALAVALLLDEDPAVEALADEIARRVAAAGDEKVLVLLAGAPHSTSSTTAFRLRRALRARGEATLWIRLEDWSVPVDASERQPHEAVVSPPDRYPLAAVSSAVDSLLQGRSVETPAQYDPAGCSVLLVEGPYALLLEDDGKAIRVHVEAPSEEEQGEEDRELAAARDKAQVRLTPLRLQTAAVASAGAHPESASAGAAGGAAPGREPDPEKRNGDWKP